LKKYRIEMNLMHSHSNDDFASSERRRLLEALEACRPGTDDFERLLDAETVRAIRGDGELTERHRRLQKFDAAVGRAFVDVPVPADFESRLLAALAADTLVAAVEENTSLAGAISPEPAPSAPFAATSPDPRADEVRPAQPPTVATARWSRRGWMAACGALTAATAAGLTGVWFLRRDTREMTVEQLLDEAFALHQSDSQATAIPVDRMNPPADFPFSDAIWRPALLRRRSLDGRFLGRPGVAFELAADGGPRATLYVLGDRFGSQQVVGVADSPSSRPGKTTGGRALGAWRQAGFLYVFVVEGDGDRYRSYFSKSAEVYA
jgi:hypothetical protein